MKKSIVLAAIIALSTVSNINATTVGFSPAFDARTVVTNTLATVGASSVVLVGHFLTPAAVTFNTAISIQDNVTAIKAAGGWRQLGVDTTTDTPNSGVTSGLGISTVPFAGKVNGSITDNNAGATKANFFNGKAIYVWIFNDAIAAASQMGIFTAATADVAWLFPANAGGVGDDITLSTIAAEASMSAVGIVPVGSVNSTQLILAAVPEPSTAFLSVLGAVAMAVRRRRTRN